MSSPQDTYGFRYFDRRVDFKDDDQEEYESASCPANCCDNECECDDCERCSINGTVEPEALFEGAAA